MKRGDPAGPRSRSNSWSGGGPVWRISSNRSAVQAVSEAG